MSSGVEIKDWDNSVKPHYQNTTRRPGQYNVLSDARMQNYIYGVTRDNVCVQQVTLDKHTSHLDVNRTLEESISLQKEGSLNSMNEEDTTIEHEKKVS